MSEQPNDTLKLTKPVQVDHVDYESLTLRELTIEELMAFGKSHGQKSGFEYDVPYFALMCGVPSKVISSLGQRDYKRLTILHKSFLTVEGEQEDLLA